MKHLQKVSPANLIAVIRRNMFVGVIVVSIVPALFSCQKLQSVAPSAKGKIVYVETNDFHDNQNAVLAYSNDGDGKLVQIKGSPFLTNGAGLGNPAQVLGPDDQDTPIMTTADGKYLLAVNSGSNTIAVFMIKNDGSLEQVPGSPFPSNGQNPVSLSTSGQYLFVVNKSQDPLHPVTQKPNYASFTISPAGWLSPVAGGKYETSEGSSPAQALVSNNSAFLFGTDFLAFMLDPARGTLRSFTISSSGTLMPVAGTPQMIPGAGGALGLWQHPKDNTLYAGFPVQGKVGVYSIDPTSGALAFKTSVAAGAAACWLRTNYQGDRLYVLNSGENTISVYNTASSLSPVFMDKLTLKQSGPGYGANNAPSSAPFGLGFSPSGKFLYVENQHTNPDFTVGSYNYLHCLGVQDDGRLVETAEPVQMPVAANVRPQGIAVY